MLAGAEVGFTASAPAPLNHFLQAARHTSAMNLTLLHVRRCETSCKSAQLWCFHYCPSNSTLKRMVVYALLTMSEIICQWMQPQTARIYICTKLNSASRVLGRRLRVRIIHRYVFVTTVKHYAVVCLSVVSKKPVLSRQWSDEYQASFFIFCYRSCVLYIIFYLCPH